MKITLMIALLALAGVAQANSFQAREFISNQCRYVANQAGVSYDKTQLGQVQPVPEAAKSNVLFNLIVISIEYGKQANSRENAVRMMLAKCYDNIERLYADDRDGIITPISKYK